jgi:hypothetical protein
MGFLSAVVMEASEVSSAAIYIREDAIYPKANTARILRFGLELDIHCLVVRVPSPKG